MVLVQRRVRPRKKKPKKKEKEGGTVPALMPVMLAPTVLMVSYIS